MPDYVIYDDKGNIIQKYQSVDPSIVESKPNYLMVDRQTFNSLTDAQKVKDGQVVDKTPEELAADQKIKDDLIKAEQDKRQAIINDLKKLGLKDETITYLLTPRI